MVPPQLITLPPKNVGRQWRLPRPHTCNCAHAAVCAAHTLLIPQWQWHIWSFLPLFPQTKHGSLLLYNSGLVIYLGAGGGCSCTPIGTQTDTHTHTQRRAVIIGQCIRSKCFVIIRHTSCQVVASLLVQFFFLLLLFRLLLFLRSWSEALQGRPFNPPGRKSTSWERRRRRFDGGVLAEFPLTPAVCFKAAWADPSQRKFETTSGKWPVKLVSTEWHRVLFVYFSHFRLKIWNCANFSSPVSDKNVRKSTSLEREKPSRSELQ